MRKRKGKRKKREGKKKLASRKNLIKKKEKDQKTQDTRKELEVMESTRTCIVVAVQRWSLHWCHGTTEE